MSALTLDGFVGAADSVTENFLAHVYPAIASAISPALYYAGILYWALFGYKIYAGYSALEWRDLLAKIFMTCAVFGSLSWGGFASQIYHVFVSFMESAAATMFAEEPATKTLNALFIHADQISKTLLKSSFYQINAIIEGSIILILNCLLFTITLFYMTISKLGLAITMVLLPLFIGFSLFKETRQWFMNWVSKMFHFALMYILVIAIVQFSFSAFDHYILEVGNAANYLEAQQISSEMVTNLYIVEFVLIIFMLQIKEWAAFLSGVVIAEGGSAITKTIKTIRSVR